MAIKYVIFTDEELDDIKNGIPVSDNKHDVKELTVYVSEKYYTDMMRKIKEKEINDD